MQVNSINAQNFKGTTLATPAKNFPTQNGEYSQEIELLDKLADKARSDVHPSTIIATIAAVLLAAKTAHKIIPHLRRGIITLAEPIVKGTSKLCADIANKFKKTDKIDTEKLIGNISQKADKLRQGNTESKLLDNVSSLTKKITNSDETAQKVKANLEKAGIKNGIEAFDAAVAVAAGAVALDPASDKAEEIADDYAIAQGIAEIAEFIGHA